MENENFNPNFDSAGLNEKDNVPTTPSSTPSSSQPVSPASNLTEIEKVKASILNQGAPGAVAPANLPMMNQGSDKMQQIINLIKSPKILIGVAALALILIVGGVFYYYLFLNRAFLNVEYSVKPDQLLVNNQDYSSGGSNFSLKLKPGQYKIVASKENYFPFATTVILEAKQTVPVAIDLVAYPEAKEIVEYDTAFPHLNPNQNEIVYLSAHGIAFYKLKLNDLTKTIISENIFNHIQDVAWAPSVRNACLITAENSPEIKDNQKKGNILYDPSRILNAKTFHLYDFSKYDLTTQSHQIYPEKIQYPTWHPTKEEILYHYTDLATGENSISKSKPTLENREPVIELQNQKSVFAQYSPDLEMIAYVDTMPVAGEPNNIFIYKTVPRKLDKIPTKDVYLDFVWSPDSKKLLGFKSDGNISLIDATTFNMSDLPFKIDKKHLVWLNSANGLVASVSAGGNNDKLIWYDIQSNEPKDIVFKEPNQFQTISDLFVSADDSTLYFVANETRHLFALPLVFE